MATYNAKHDAKEIHGRYVATYLVVLMLGALGGIFFLWAQIDTGAAGQLSQTLAQRVTDAQLASLTATEKDALILQIQTELATAPNPANERYLFVIILLAGALGSLIHGLRSLSWYRGNRDLVRSWRMFYFLRPLIGGGLAVAFYFIIRGGFFPNAQIDDTNPFAFIGLAILIGLFSEIAVVKLKEIAETIFTKTPTGKDSAAEELAEDLPDQPPSGLTYYVNPSGPGTPPAQPSNPETHVNPSESALPAQPGAVRSYTTRSQASTLPAQPPSE